MTPPGDEREARAEIDRLLAAAGWSVFDADKANLSAARSVAIREFARKDLKGRWEFEGTVATDVREQCVGKSVGKGGQNPIRYLEMGDPRTA